MLVAPWTGIYQAHRSVECRPCRCHTLPPTFSAGIGRTKPSLPGAPAALNTFGIWVALMIALTVVNYGFPIAQLAMLEGTSVPAVRVGER